jgi:GTP cyclohydrolase IA
MEPSVLVNPRQAMVSAIQDYLTCAGYDQDPHVADTPERFATYLEHIITGFKNEAEEVLSSQFASEACDQMIHRRNVRVLSTCKHHLLPFIGLAHFAYLPNKKIVGISKIPRLIRMYSRRLQVQEELTEQIVSAFQTIVEPHGCGLSIRAYHFCEILRGVEEPAALTETTALRGSFKSNAQTRDEFLRSIDRSEMIFG